MNAVLVANRGEIAVRIIRAARELGMRTIAVYSELDRDAPHVAMADEAWNIGAAPAAESYLNGERILEVAAAADADTVHPGYGFLAENAPFAAAVVEAGLTWVGPPPDAIAVMGDKISSRKAAAKADVRAVPGTLDPLDSAEAVAAAAAEFGFPIVIKAAHGGGGKGLKVVRAREELERAFESASREADQYFANPEVYVEKYLTAPRHIEAQIMFDHHGAGAFLGERDCSVQRRHQKLIEEAPAIGLTDGQRQELSRASLAVAEAADYQNAGTVEFLLERETGEFYFLEMNTRLQVEHTVTEMVTGFDLVQEQFRIAAGEPLSIPHMPPVSGHAIELRINAEDPGRNFLPNPGTIVGYREPGGFGVRVDSGVQAGWQVSQYYDNLLAKLVVWGRDRTEAIARAQRALAEFEITGISTTIPAHQLVLAHPEFVAGNHHTRFIEEEVDLSGISRPTAPTLPEDESVLERNITVEVGGRRYDVRVWTPEVAPTTGGQAAPRRRPPKLERRNAETEDAGVVVAPMQGTIVKLHHKAGDSVGEGQPLCVLEAMKMENEIAAPIGGEIVDLRVQTGDTVSKGQVLAIVK